MNRARLSLSALLLVAALGCLCGTAAARQRPTARPAAALLAFQGGTFQQAAPSATPNPRDVQCMSRRADWERNRIPWSLFLGFIIFLAAIYLLTFLRFKNTMARGIVSVTAAVLMGMAMMAVIVQDQLRVCLSPPGFWGSLSAPMLWWTLGGSLGTWVMIGLLRFLMIRRRFRQELPAE